MNLEKLPLFLSESILMMKIMMTPLVLLFIGVAVIFKWGLLRNTSLLTFRAKITVLLSGAFILLFPLPSDAAVLMAVVFPQSACSFWPFAHMSAVRALDNTNPALEDKPTFDLELGVNVFGIIDAFQRPFDSGFFYFW